MLDTNFSKLPESHLHHIHIFRSYYRERNIQENEHLKFIENIIFSILQVSIRVMYCFYPTQILSTLCNFKFYYYAVQNCCIHSYVSKEARWNYITKYRKQVIPIIRSIYMFL